MLLIFATTGFHYLPTRTYQEVYLFTTTSSNLKVANHFKMVFWFNFLQKKVLASNQPFLSQSFLRGTRDLKVPRQHSPLSLLYILLLGQYSRAVMGRGQKCGS